MWGVAVGGGARFVISLIDTFMLFFRRVPKNFTLGIVNALCSFNQVIAIFSVCPANLLYAFQTIRLL